MVELRILGSMAVHGLPLASGRAILAQTKGFALLVYMLLTRDGGAPSREDVTALLWPDASPDRGRGALRNVLHGLRAQLGGDAIGSTGDRLSVNRTYVGCDAARFDMLLAEGRPAEALALYGGDLLPGFGVRGADQFSLWLDGQRDEFRTRAARAAWRLSELAEERSNWVTATDHARQAVRWSHNTEHGVRKLMTLLNRAGDRVAAIQEYESSVARWERDYGLTPSDETSALAEAIRLGSAPAPASGPKPWADASSPGSRLRLSDPPPRIAVLPFLRVGDDPEANALATGLADGVIAALSRVSGVRVVARGSVDRLGSARAEGASRVGEKLGVDLILDGSVRVSLDGFTVAVRLIDARRDTPLWADLYEEERSSLLPFQSELVLKVLEILAVEVSPDEERHLARPPTANARAYEFYLQGRRRWNRRSGDDAAAAIDLYEQALALDPSFALALVGLADAYLAMAPATGRRFPEARVRAREAARQALDIDPRLGEAHATMGLLRGFFDRDWHGAETEFLRAIELNPGYATAHHWYGAILSWVFERFEEGARELELARQLDPLSPVIHGDVGMALLNQGRLHQAPAKFQEALAIDPRFWRAHYGLALTAYLLGDRPLAAEHFHQAWKLGAWGADPTSAAPTPPGSWRATVQGKLDDLAERGAGSATRAFEAALLSALLGKPDDAMSWLGESEREGSIPFVLQYYPAFIGLADHPRFLDLIDRVGVRRRSGWPPE